MDHEALGRFLEFVSSTLLVPTALDECWVLSMHMGGGVHTPVGELVYRAKTYFERPGEPEAADELCRVLLEQILKHPTFQRADGIVGVPANPPKEPHNLPELLAERASSILGIPCMKGLITKLKPTEIKGLQYEDKLAALDGAYRVEDSMSSQSIILVDDLIRSGSTLGFIAGLLREKGASRVLGLAATKTVRD
ncbi:MAG: ComF family protein [Gemmatimonadota bacterium]